MKHFLFQKNYTNEKILKIALTEVRKKLFIILYLDFDLMIRFRADYFEDEVRVGYGVI